MLDSATRTKIAESILFGGLESCGLEWDSSFWLSPKRNKNFNMDFLFDFSIDSCFARIYNRSNGGVAFVFVENFGLSTRLESVEVQNFLQVRNRIPKTQIVKQNLA